MPVTVPTEYVEIVDAYRFLDAVGANADLKAAWQKLLDDLGSQTIDPQKKVALINNFLLQRKYKTTAAVVLDFVKSEWWQSYRKALTATPTSDRFVQDLLTRPVLLAEYNRMIQATLGTDTTGDATADGKINVWMAKKGYDCTTEQVKASWDKMRDQNVNFWTGRYGDTVQQKQDADGKPVGTVTSGGYAPSLAAPVAMGYVSVASAAPGTPVSLLVRGKTLAGEVVPLPFVPHRYVKHG